MDFKCDHCEKSFTRQYNLKVHKLKEHDGMTTVNKQRHQQSHQALVPKAQSFKFKHPFCMLVAGPSHSGKTSWTVKLLAERRECFQPPVDTILYCYSQWQKNYDDLKRLVPSTQFHQGQPSMEILESLQNGILVLDDLMEESVNDSKIMNMFIVGSHHRNISVFF